MDALALVSAGGQLNTRASQQTNDSNMASSAQLHKQLLAAEVAKLRKELVTLKTQQQKTSVGAVSDALKQARMQKERKEAEKAEVVAQANSQKQLLAGEVRSLRGEVQGLKGNVSNPLAAPGSPMKAGSVGMLPENVAEALERRKAFEEQFSMTLRSMREELMDTSIKRLSGRSQTPQGVRALLVLSDERINRIMAEAAKVPVDERLHIEAIRLFIENCKFRKALNEYARAILQNALVKDDASSAPVSSTFGII
mmetsp:Transcript_83160/g.134846  ORF Transcript_83160/g.134846 Transcript_83160/m.134846 type:complete len:254 (+) Transcript_83160:96-857(+)